MPFLYTLTVTPGEPPATPRTWTFVQQLIPAGSLAGTGQPLATLTDGTMGYHVPAPLQGLVAAWLAQHGDAIEPGDPLARIVAEGEEVPVPPATPTRLG